MLSEVLHTSPKELYIFNMTPTIDVKWTAVLSLLIYFQIQFGSLIFL